ncbi:MAG: glycosyl hydrolase 115 family protein [Treponema sp.]|nr:glycosyl hydrolase 115 family protein [Treponema sp.]
MKIEVKNGKLSTKFVCDSKELSGVKKIADKVRLDFERVTGYMPELSESLSDSSILFGTLGYSDLIQKELSADIIEKIKGKREVYAFIVSESKIIIAGSDKRGTIYGLFHLSELMGVSPLVDWADILPSHKDFISFQEGLYISKEPSVRFRGFFINDEWPACGNWCNHNFGGFNAKMYEHVFELLLRLKGNYLWPAMWSSRFSDDGPGLANAELADELGVIMGASHHEPCCRAGEEYKHLRGPDSIYGDAWNFRSNQKGITKFWEDGLKRSGKFENVITVGMRGEADTAIMQNATLADNIELLRDVLKTQNSLIKEYVNSDLDKVPRMLALYKEVEPYFYGDEKTPGLMNSPELEGVTLMLCDDNHGNLRTVPTEAMRSHKGGYGMYYHFDYHGWPFSYEWFNTSYLPKVKEQMCAAYDFGIRDLWIVNVGDVMTNELPLAYFLDLAYDYEYYSKSDSLVQDYVKSWADKNFAALKEDEKNQICKIVNTYTKLTNLRRTECLMPDTFHPINFCESDKTLAQANQVIEMAEKLREKIPENLMPGYFLEVFLPACGTMNVLRMQLYSGKNKWFAKHSALAANFYADKVRECYKYDQRLIDECDTIDNGKFYASGWSEHFGFINWSEAENQYPTYTYVEPTRKKRFIAWLDGNEITTTGRGWTMRDFKLKAFKNPECQEARIKIAGCYQNGVPFTVDLTGQGEKWLKLTIESDKEKQIETIVVKIDRKALAQLSQKKESLIITSNDGNGTSIQVNVEIDAEELCLDYPKGTYIQTENYISMEAEHFSSKAAGQDSSAFEVLPGYGKTLGAVKAFPVIKSFPEAKNAPFVEYSFVTEKAGDYDFIFYLNPSNPAYKDNKLDFAFELNGELQIIPALDSEKFRVGDNQQPWGQDVTNNIRRVKVQAKCKDKLNKMKIYPVSPNLVLEKIVICDSNYRLPESYLGPGETFRIS